MLARLPFALIAPTMLAMPAMAQNACSPVSLATAAVSVRDARSALIAVPVGDMDTDLPPVARAAIEHLKDRLQTYVEARMACTPAAATPRAITASLRADGDAGDRGPNSDGHGRELDYAAEPVSHHPGWIAIVPFFGIECGSDSIALFYRRDGAHWRLAMIRRAAPYKEVSGGWEGLTIDTSPTGADGRWYVALTHGTPWCTSVWSAYHYELARPTADPRRPDIFLHGDLGFNRGYRTAVRATPGWFEVRLVDFSHDTDILVRTSIHRWAIDGDRTHRVPPVAPTAQDFVDEWLMTPWREARAWSAPGLAALHNRLGSADGNQHALLTSFGKIRACSARRTEVALEPETGPAFYLMVDRNGLGFRLLGITRRHDLRCSGPDRKHDQPALPVD